MQTHQIKRSHKNKRDRIVGRGGKHAKTSGRGTKGQNARSGRKKRPELRDIIKKIPKLRGRGVSSFKSFRVKPAVVNLSEIEKVFSSGDKVNPETLIKNGLVESRKGRTPKVKILGTGDLTKNISLSGCEISASVKEKIEKAGGSVETKEVK